MYIYIYIYIYAFSRRFYPKRLTLHSSYSFYILSALAFPGNRTHDLGVASAMLYQLSYRKAHVSFWNVLLISVALLLAFNSPKSALNVFWAAERSFSKLKLIKTYSRSTMSQEHLGGLAVISINNDSSPNLSFDAVIDDFSANNSTFETVL